MATLSVYGPDHSVQGAGRSTNSRSKATSLGQASGLSIETSLDPLEVLELRLSMMIYTLSGEGVERWSSLCEVGLGSMSGDG